MKRFCFIILACITVTIQGMAQDYALLEVLISNHKSLSNRLKERITIEASVAVQTEQVEQKTTNYEEMVQKLSKRMEGALQNAQFALDVANLTARAVKITKKSTETAEYVLEVAKTNPEVVMKADEVLDGIGQQINDIVKLTGMVVTGGTGVSLATNEQRAQFCFIIRDRLEKIDDILMGYKRYCTAASYRNQSFDEALGVLQGKLEIRAYESTVELLGTLKWQ